MRVCSPLLALLFLCVAASVGHAQTPPAITDQLIPYETPSPVGGLIARIPGVPVLMGGSSVGWNQGLNMTSLTQGPVDGTYGPYLRYDAFAPSLVPKIDLSMPAFVAQGQVGSLDPAQNGATISFFYRKQIGTPYDEWNPLLLTGPVNNWRVGVWMQEGVPLLAVRRNANAPWNFLGLGGASIDDGAWHHLAFRLSRPGCTATSCDAPTEFFVTLLVDGDVRDEATTTILTGAGFNQVVIGNGSYQGTTYNTIADLDDVEVFNQPLSMSEIRRIARSRNDGLRFQVPILPPSQIGWLKKSNGLWYRPPGATASVDLLKEPTTQGARVDGVRVGLDRSLKDLTGHTFAAWISRPTTNDTGFEWVSQTDAALGAQSNGWKLVANGTTATMRCSFGGEAQVTYTAETQVLFTVRYDGGVLRWSINQQEGAPVACEIPAAQNPVLWFHGAASSELYQAVLYGGSKPLPELASIASPGAALWFDPPNGPLVGVPTPGPITTYGEEGTDLFTPVAPSPAGTARVVVVPVQDRWLAGTDESRDFTLSFTVNVERIEQGQQAVIAKRSGANGTADAQVRLERRAANDPQLVLRMFFPKSGAMTMFAVAPPGLVIGQPADISVTWTGERTLPARTAVPGQPVGASLTVTEPIVVVNQVQINRQYASDPATFTEVALFPWSRSAPMTRWTLGDDTGNYPAATAPRYRLRHVRLFPRPVLDTTQIGMDCVGGASAQCTESGRVCVSMNPAALGSNSCGGCDATSFDAGGVGPFDHDCQPKRDFHERCASDNHCLSGICHVDDPTTGVGKCISRDANVCAQCTELGRTCVNLTIPGGGVDCAQECAPGFTPLPGTNPSAPDAPCLWRPTKEDGEVCEGDGECFSGSCPAGAVIVDSQSRVKLTQAFQTTCSAPRERGSCRTDPQSTCDVPCDAVSATYTKEPYTRTERRCLSTDPSFCSKPPNYTVASFYVPVARLPNGQPPPPGRDRAYVCEAGERGTCLHSLVRRQRVLSTGACERAARNAHIPGWLPNPTTGRAACLFDRFGDVCGYPTSKYPIATRGPNWEIWNRGFGLSMNDLKRLFIPDDPNPYRPSDYNKLVDMGVGQLLIAYADADRIEKIAMMQKYGDFQPLAACAGNPDISNSTVYNNQTNYMSCQPQLQANGARCPPLGSEQLTQPAPFSGSAQFTANDFCRSGYCARDTKLCEDGFNPYTEIGAGAGNKSKKARGKVSFGLVRVDDTRLDVKRSVPGPVTDQNADLANQLRRYRAWVNQSHVLCIFGKPFPDAPLFETRIDIDRTNANERCSKTTVTTHVLGMTLTAPPPGPIAGSCTGYSATYSGWAVCEETIASCTPVDFNRLASGSTLVSMAIPTRKFCAPLGDAVPEFKEDLNEFLVPLYVVLGPKLDLCIDLNVGLDDTGMPQLEIRPHVGLGVEARAGVGSAGRGYEIGVGIRLALTVIDLAFPVTWGLSLSDAQTPEGIPVPGLLKLAFVIKQALEISLLAGEFGFYATFSIGPFTIEKTINIFTWVAIKLTYNLAEKEFGFAKLDFRAQFAGALEYSNKAAECNPAPKAPCYQP